PSVPFSLKWTSRSCARKDSSVERSTASARTWARRRSSSKVAIAFTLVPRVALDGEDDRCRPCRSAAPVRVAALTTGAAAQQASQRVEPGGAGRAGTARLHPRVEGAVGFVVCAAAGAVRGTLRQVRKVFDEGGGIHVPESEGPHAGCVDHPATAGQLQGHRAGGRVAATTGDHID